MRYVAVNDTACRALGYSREELLDLSVPDVACEPEAARQYDEMLVRGFRYGRTMLTRSDGTTVEFMYRAARTRVAGLSLFVSVGFLAD
jgi:PAS domain S-box-containing protein